MSFCCGASKIGVIKTIKRNGIAIHNVPVLYCPVCQSEEPHPRVEENLNFIVDLATEDRMSELDLDYYLNLDGDYAELFESCSTVYKGNKGEVVQSQIDISLDLLSVSRQIKDIEWEETLKKRLSILSKQRDVTKNK